MNNLFTTDIAGVEDLSKFIISQLEDYGLDNFRFNKYDLDTVFLAGAPGSGKTEFVEGAFSDSDYVIIDIDKYRWFFKGYTGTNANEGYNSAAITVANKVYKFCMNNNLKLVLDGTFSNKNLAIQNIDKCIKKGRDFSIIYIYQDPLVSFAYTKARELKGKRKVPLKVFIDKYFLSIQTTFEIIEKYKDSLLSFFISHKSSTGFSSISDVTTKDEFIKKFNINDSNIGLKKKLTEINSPGFDLKNYLDNINPDEKK